MQIHLAIHEILADKAFTATDGLISQSFIVAFVHPINVWIAFICVIATTRHSRTNDLTTSKALQWAIK